MKVNDTKICLDCDEVFPGEMRTCPACGSGGKDNFPPSSVDLRNYLAPLPTKPDLERAMRAQALGDDIDGMLMRLKQRALPDEGDWSIGACV